MRALLKKNALAVRVVKAARSKRSALASRSSLKQRVAELEARMSVVDGRSLLNAERNVRTHSSMQNLAEDFEASRKAEQSGND